MSGAPLRALLRLSGDAVLMREREGPGYGVFPKGDRRRRPLARLTAEMVRDLEAQGALAGENGVFRLSDAGRARLRRETAREGEAFMAQHAPVVDRAVVDEDGDLRAVRGLEAAAVLRRLSELRDTRGAPWLSRAELAAAAQLRQDWERAQVGMMRGSDWRGPPMGSAPRGAGNDAAMAARCDAGRRLDAALTTLATPLRRTVERVCLYDEGLAGLERAEGWPARSGKLALKLGLAQLAAAL